MLDRLPCEILLLIAHELPKATQWVLSRTSSRLFTMLVPLIYHTLTIQAASEWALNVLDVDSFFLHHDQVRASEYLKHTRDLQIRAPIHLARFNRCAYYNVFRIASQPGSSCLGTPNDALAHSQFLDDIADHLRRITAQIQPHSLRTFQWRLGTCIPEELLGRNGYLARQQKRLTGLSLTTDGTCPHACRGLDGLSELRSLTSLQWEGLQHFKEVASLRQCVRLNHQHLAHLSVGFIPSASAETLMWEDLALDESPRIGVEDGNDHLETPIKDWGVEWERSSMVHVTGTNTARSLISLSLFRVTFSLTCLVPDSSVFWTLRALTLRSCPNQLQLLRDLTRGKGRLQLQYFECCFDLMRCETNEQCDPKVLAQFLRSFRGLQHLYLRLSNFPVDCQIQEAIRHHGTTLQNLVYHERQLTSIDERRLFEEDRDISPNWLWDLPSVVDFSQMKALALSASPDTARACLRSGVQPSRLQLLHLRFNGPERIHRDIRQEISACYYDRERILASSGWSRIGMAARLVSLLSSTEPFSREMTRKGLELTEAEDFVAFATWAFGPQGLPSLKVLAYGDFSHEDRYHSQQFLVRRREASRKGSHGDLEDSERCQFAQLPFKPMCLSHPCLWDGVVVDGTRFLSACPGGGLMESPYEI